MTEPAQKKNVELFDRIVKNLSAAIKNSALYPPGHPSLASCITNLASTLRAWFASTDKLDLGVTPDNLLVNGDYPKKDPDVFYAEAAAFLHARGVVSLSFKPDIADPELGEFLKAITRDPKTLAAEGGIAKRMARAAPHILIREVDYSALLRQGKAVAEAAPASDREVWQTLVQVAELGSGGELPSSKIEFLSDFLANPEKSASVLNKIYKEALARVDDNAAVGKMRGALMSISRYFAKNGGRETGAVRRDIADLILRLDPALVARLFDEGAAAGPGAELSDEILQALPDDTVADFIASLVGREGAVNKHLLKFFDKLVTEERRPGNMTAIVADKLFDMKFLDKDLLSRLQLSVKDMMKTSPDSNFLSEMYKMTVETFVDSSVGLAYRSDEYLRIARESGEALKYDSLLRQEVNLILNLLWLERDGEQFRKLCDLLMKKFDEIVDVLNIQVVREIYELFLEKLDQEIRGREGFERSAAMVVDKITSREVLDRIIALIRDSGPFEVNNIIRIIGMTKPTSIRLAVDAYVLAGDELWRDRVTHVILTMGSCAVEELRKRLQQPEGLSSAVTMGLFEMVRRIDPQETQSLARFMLRHKNSRVRMEALTMFTPRDESDAEALISMLRSDEADDIGDKVIFTLLKSGDPKTVDMLFRAVRTGAPKKKYLLAAIKLCGDFKIAASFNALRDIVALRPFFYTKAVDSVRVAAVVSLAQLGTPESMELVSRAASDRSETVRRMSGIILNLGKDTGRRKTSGEK